MSDEPDETSAAEAFDQLRAEVALLRRAVEGLAAERNASPDHGPTIEKLVERQDAVAAALRRTLTAPALQLTPEALASAIERAGQQAREQDRLTIETAARELAAMGQQLARVVAGARTADRQTDALIWACTLAMGGTAALLALSRALFGS